MVELKTRKREYRGNHHAKLGVKIISFATQFIIPDTAGTSPDAACIYTNTVKGSTLAAVMIHV